MNLSAFPKLFTNPSYPLFYKKVAGSRLHYNLVLALDVSQPLTSYGGFPTLQNACALLLTLSAL